MTTQADHENHRNYTRALELAQEAASRLDDALTALKTGVNGEPAPRAAALFVQLFEAAGHIDRAVTQLDAAGPDARKHLLREHVNDDAEVVEQLYNV